MTVQNDLMEKVTKTDFIITREYNAPRELVFKAWSEADRLVQWWGPKGFQLGVAALDFRPGGIFHYSMQAANGETMWGRFVYQEMVAPERIVFINSFSNEEGEITKAPFSEIWPLEILNILTLTEQDGKTILNLRGGPINANAEEQQIFNNMHESMQQGFGATFDQLNDYLAKA